MVAKRNPDKRHKDSTPINVQILRLRRRAYRDIIKNVAKATGRTESMVRLVASGKKKSPKLLRALIEEMARIERAIERKAGVIGSEDAA